MPWQRRREYREEENHKPDLAAIIQDQRALVDAARYTWERQESGSKAEEAAWLWYQGQQHHLRFLLERAKVEHLRAELILLPLNNHKAHRRERIRSELLALVGIVLFLLAVAWVGGR